MKLTNRNHYPDALYQAMMNDSYSKGDSDFSVTELAKPSRQWSLQKAHAEDLVEDVEDRLWSLYGQIAHLILERANRKDFAEKRLFVEIDDKIISGQIDTLSLEDGTLSDWKFTSSFGFKTGTPPKDEWVAQLNMQRYLLWHNDYMNVKKLRIIGLLRDWKESDVEKIKNHPKHPIAYHDIPMWSLEETEKFIIHRKDSHLRALKALPKCSSKETWNTRRCKSWCNVSSYCSQYNNALKTGKFNE